jgi:hypothetical protein
MMQEKQAMEDAQQHQHAIIMHQWSAQALLAAQACELSMLKLGGLMRQAETGHLLNANFSQVDPRLVAAMASIGAQATALANSWNNAHASKSGSPGAFDSNK